MGRAAARRGIIFVLSAPSGTGKTTLGRRLIRKAGGIRFSVSYTTRRPRRGEVPGSDYHFVAEAEFERLRSRGELLEWARVDGHFYGTSRRQVSRGLAVGQDLLLDIDSQGADQVRRRARGAVLIFLMPPSAAALRSRHRRRGSDPETAARRLALARREMRQFRRYDYVVINDRIEEAFQDLHAIVRAERCRIWRRIPAARKILRTF